MSEHRWSREDPADPLSHHLDEDALRYECNEEDPLAEEWYDAFVLVTRRTLKRVVGDAVSRSNQAVWNKLTELENAIMSNQDQLNAFAAGIAADVQTIKDEVQALKDANSAGETLDFSSLQSAVDSLHQTATDNAPPAPVSTEPPADGEPVNSGDPQTLPVSGSDGLPVTNFPAEDTDSSDAPATDSDVPAPSGAEAGDAPAADSASE